MSIQDFRKRAFFQYFACHRGWVTSEPDACSDKTEICEDPERFSCSFKGCKELPEPQDRVVRMGTSGGAMKSSTISAACGDGDVYTTLSRYDSVDHILAVDIPKFEAVEVPDSTHCLPDSCLPTQGYNWTTLQFGGFTVTGCRTDKQGTWCGKSNNLAWNGTDLLYSEPPETTNPQNDYWEYCPKKDGSCKPAPQYCPAAECISDNIEWEEPALINVKHTGCSYVEGDKYFQHDVGKARCPVKESVKVRDGVVYVDTTKAENMKECKEWTETAECARKSLYMLETSEVEDNSLLHKFLLSEDGCDAGAQLEIVDNELKSTEEFVLFQEIPQFAVEIGAGTPETSCFKVHHNLCGPDSLSFGAGNLLLTVCDSLLQMNPEDQDCGSKFNQCWRTDPQITDPESFKFLIFNEDTKIVADDNEELAKVIEETVKAKGFFEDQEFVSPSFVTVKCLGNDKWEFSDESLK